MPFCLGHNQTYSRTAMKQSYTVSAFSGGGKKKINLFCDVYTDLASFKKPVLKLLRKFSPIPVRQHDCMLIDFMRKFSLALPWDVEVLAKELLSMKDRNRDRSVCSF